MFTREQRQEAYKKLSPERQDFVMSNETTDIISDLIKESGLNGDQADLADSEILYALLGLQTLDTAITNIAKIGGKSTDDLSKLKSNLQNKIFNHLDGTKQETATENQPKDNFISKLEDNKTKANAVRKSGDQKEVQEKLAKLSPSLRAYINGGIWKQSVSKISTQLNLKQEVVPKLENEVFLVLICLEPPSDFVENIKSEIGVDESTARTISNYINGTVFGVVMKDIKEAWAPNSASNSAKAPIDKSEETINPEEEEWGKMNYDNIAKAMGVDMPPENLPVGDGPKLVHNYTTKTDPYRELPE